ncbi:energy-coupling factor transporter ATP-binding protein EcfA1 [Paenibacillus radicis (ex Gao et al. 2016)]|uniref:Energy-coupling factor transporter ATP-binding protein EcfA1 n=1 Tax=Paenibacillus radicis (ex Gao et al. 2016) TaxID=1737354 RepID=A0A917HI25_9BACL|nr:energy-coupling factor transporter ATP-binding protein EcfA1 [Paenibacillus radicis (ex Gao et al. 2016)]
MLQLTDVAVRAFTANEQEEPVAILKNIHMRVEQGEWIALIGRNGSGKSTLLKLIAGFQAGEASGFLDWGDALASRSGIKAPIVMQQPEASMVGATPIEDLIIMLEQNGVKGELIAEQAANALARTGMLDRGHQPVGTLSGGQKQRVAIAGCLAVDAPILLMDEPTAMLDPEASIYVHDIVRKLNRSGIAVIWITQKLDELREGDRVIALEQGEIVFDGAAEGFYARSRAMDSVCERLGFEAPYVVQTAWELEKHGVELASLPLTPAALAKAVQRR